MITLVWKPRFSPWPSPWWGYCAAQPCAAARRDRTIHSTRSPGPSAVSGSGVPTGAVAGAVGAVKGTGNPWKLWKIIIFLLEESGKSRFFDGNLTILMHFEWDLFRIFAGKLNKFSWENHKSELEHHPYFERKSQCFEHARTPFDNAHYNVPFGQPWSKVSRPGCNCNATKPVTHVCLLPGLSKKCS